MAFSAQPKFWSNIIHKAFQFSVLFALVLILYSLLRFPGVLTTTTGLRSLAGAVLILVIYGVVDRLWISRVERTNPLILPLASIIGLVIGVLFATQMFIEYLVPITSEQDGVLALITFGVLFLLFFLCSFIAMIKTGSFRAALLSAICSGLAGSIIWFLLLMSTYYLFLGTSNEAHFLEIDQVLADFQRSGMTDLRTFILEDYLGGGFFHLFLAPIFACLFGTLGYGVGKGFRSMRTAQGDPI